MEEKLPEEEIVQEEHVAEEIPLQPVETQTGQIGNIPLLFSSLIRDVFGPADYLENDRRYKKIVRQNYETWAKNHPGEFRGKLFVRTKTGNLIINPELEKQFPTLGIESKSQFAKRDPDRAEFYKKAEKTRRYLDKEEDPAIKRLHKDIASQKTQSFWKPEPGKTFSQQGIEAEKQEYKKFVNEHPEKARYYARSDPKIKAAFEEHNQEEWAKKSRTQRSLTRLNSPDLVPVAEKKSWMPKRMRRASDWYDNKKDQAKQWFIKSKAGRLLGWNKIQQSKVSQGYQTRRTVLKERFNQTKVGQTYQKYTSFKNYFVNKREEIKQRARNYAVKKFLPQSIQKFSPKNIAGKLLKKLFSALAKRLPGLAGVIARGLLGAKKILGNMFRQGVRGLKKAAGALIKQGTKYVAQAAARAMAGVVASTAPVWLPFVIIGAGVVGFIFLLIIIIVALFGGGDASNTDIPQTNNQTTVSISKTGPTGVPDQNTPITYSITASANQASSLTVTDYIPDNAVFISSNPQGKLFDASNIETQDPTKAKTVVWTSGAGIASPTTAAGDTPQPTSPPAQGSTLSQTISITLKSLNNDTYVLNKAVANATPGRSGGGGSAPPGTNEPPNQDNCNGAYTLDSGQHNGKNFGDPTCDLAQSAKVSSPLNLSVYGQGVIPLYPKQSMIDEIKKYDSNYERWISISACEAPGFDPNNWSSHEATGTPDLCGAWGLFQAGSNEPTEGDCSQPYKIPGVGRNGEFDRGDVNWRTQIYNATSYGKMLDEQGIPLGGYWQCAQ